MYQNWRPDVDPVATKQSDHINFKEHLQQLQTHLPTLGLQWLGEAMGGHLAHPAHLVSSAMLLPSDKCLKTCIEGCKSCGRRSNQERNHKFTASKKRLSKNTLSYLSGTTNGFSNSCYLKASSESSAFCQPATPLPGSPSLGHPRSSSWPQVNDQVRNKEARKQRHFVVKAFKSLSSQAHQNPKTSQILLRDSLATPPPLVRTPFFLRSISSQAPGSHHATQSDALLHRKMLLETHIRIYAK